jgi:hypothetical protein
MRSFPANGSGSGGGSFFGTQTLDNGMQPLLGFINVAPIVTVLSSVDYDVDVQWANLVCDAYRLSDFNSKVVSQNKLFYVFNLTPSNPGANSTGGGWSTITVFRSDGLFEVFALIWTEAFSYQFVAAQTPFQLQPDGSILAMTDEPTSLDLYVSGTYPTPPPKTLGYSDAVAALRVGFVCSARLFVTTNPQQRSSRLQSYVAAGSM